MKKRIRYGLRSLKFSVIFRGGPRGNHRGSVRLASFSSILHANLREMSDVNDRLTESRLRSFDKLPQTRKHRCPMPSPPHIGTS